MFFLFRFRVENQSVLDFGFVLDFDIQNRLVPVQTNDFSNFCPSLKKLPQFTPNFIIILNLVIMLTIFTLIKNQIFRVLNLLRVDGRSSHLLVVRGDRGFPREFKQIFVVAQYPSYRQHNILYVYAPQGTSQLKAGYSTQGQRFLLPLTIVKSYIYFVKSKSIFNAFHELQFM